MDLHLFDFDGTLFFSPSPNRAKLIKTYGKALTDALYLPLQAGGLAWFQSLSSMSPPAVPENPPYEKWYVQPMVDHLRQIASTKETSDAKVYVLTGRDVKYRQRIEHLLENAGLLSLLEETILKPTEDAGTVKYKLNTMLSLIRKHKPRHVYYYEDRFEQGGRLGEGIRQLQRQLFPGENPSYSLELLPSFRTPDVKTKPLLSIMDLCNGDNKAVNRAMGQATRWVQSAVGGEPHANLDGSAVPKFDFTMYFVPPEALQSEDMLSEEETKRLVEKLQAEHNLFSLSRQQQ